MVSCHSFVSPLYFNKRGQAAVAAWQKSVCELRYHRSCIHPKNSNLIKKKVGRRTEKSSKPHHFSSFFLRCCSVSINPSRRRQQGENGSVSRDITDSRLALKIAI
jgi:hypothetical protein